MNKLLVYQTTAAKHKVGSSSNRISYNVPNDVEEHVLILKEIKKNLPGSKIFGDLKEYYEKKLPNPTEDKGFVVYNCFEGQRKPFVVSLTDNSTPNMGIINLVIYKDK